MRVVTEDLGKILERAVCIVYSTSYDGKYKYSEERAQVLAQDLGQLRDHLPYDYKHTAKGGAPYDFDDGKGHKLSCKSNKRGSKVAPHTIGQAQPEKFCEILNIPYTDKPALKSYLQTPGIINNTVLPVLESNTFDSPIIYCQKKDDKTYRKQLIKQIKPLPWNDNNLKYSWTRTPDKWVSSSTLKVNAPDDPSKSISILEVQFHSKRTNMAIRWSLLNVLNRFPECFQRICL